VDKVNADGSMDATATYDAVQYKMTGGPMGNVEYDSTKGGDAPAHPMAKVFSAIAGASLNVTFAADGKVKEVKGTDKLMDTIITKMEMPAAQQAQMREAMKAQFGEEGIKSSFEQMTAFYPKEPVAIGDSWENKMTLAAGMPLSMANTYTLKGRQGGVAAMDVKTTITTDDKPVNMGGQQMSYNLKGEQVGTLNIDEATGWLKSGKMTQTIDGTLTMNAGGQKMEMPMKLNSDVVFEEAKKE